MHPVMLMTAPALPDHKPIDRAVTDTIANSSRAANTPAKVTPAPPDVIVRPAPRPLALRPDAAYLIVGGLRGLCGSLALRLAEHGARHLVVMPRSGCNDEWSQAIIEGCAALDCRVHDAKGDVTRAEDVQRVSAQAPTPIASVIQRAMVLRVRAGKPFLMPYSALRLPAKSTYEMPQRPSASAFASSPLLNIPACYCPISLRNLNLLYDRQPLIGQAL
jgi:hypothetical protein